MGYAIRPFALYFNLGLWFLVHLVSSPKALMSLQWGLDSAVTITFTSSLVIIRTYWLVYAPNPKAAIGMCLGHLICSLQVHVIMDVLCV